MTLRNLPGSIYNLVMTTCEAYAIDIVIFDMSPSLGAVNQNLWAISDYFIIPMNPDYFALMAIDSLANFLPKWKAWTDRAGSVEVLQKAEYPFPASAPKFLGYVMQKYRPRKQGAPSAAFLEWIEQVEQRMAKVLLPVFEKNGLLLTTNHYASAGIDPKTPLLQMSDFDALIARSQEHQVPVFELSDEQLAQVGKVLKDTKTSMERFERLFSEAADKVIRAVDYAVGS